MPLKGRVTALKTHITAFQKTKGVNIATKKEIQSIKTIPTRGKIKKTYATEITSLKKTDKGLVVIILSKEDYIAEANRQFSDTNFY